MQEYGSQPEKIRLMTSEYVFLTLNTLFFIPWVVLFTSKKPAFVHWRDKPSPLSVMALLYGGLIIYSIFLNGGLTNMFDFALLKKSFQQDEVMILGWLHYLIFDLFVGIHVQNRIYMYSAPTRVSILVLCLMLGPLGYFFYVVHTYFRS